jgi:N-sulfoglucosamine sulfohydrolase
MWKYVLVAVATGLVCVAAERPSILLFTADDLHSGSLATYGSKLDMTPNLDRFGREGLIFDRGYVNAAICSPCRKIIATGLFGHNSGAMGFRDARVGTPNVIDTLHDAGYLTGLIDKVPHSTPFKGTKWDYVKGDKKDETAYGRSPSLFYKHVTEFLGRCKAEKKPFYLMVNSRDPHRKYCKESDLGHPLAEKPSKFYSPDEVEVPGFLPDIEQVRKESAEYQNSVRRMDDTFGRTIQALDESGFRENTLVIFISDNGHAMPFAKANAYYFASRTPMLMQLPGVIKPGRRDSTHFVSVVDFFPTFLEYTGAKGPDVLDGRSFLSIIKGETQENRDRVYTQIDALAGGNPYPMRAVQTKRFLYVYNAFSNGDGKVWYRNNNEGGVMAQMTKLGEKDPLMKARVDLFRHRVPEELFDVVKDPDCLNNLVASPEHAAQLKSLRGQLADEMKSGRDPILKAFENRNDRAAVEKVIVDTYGKLAPSGPKQKKPKKKPKKK